MARRRGTRQPLKVESLTHEAAGRSNIPSAEHQPLLKDDERHPIEAAFERRNPDLDPQLIWRGKDPADWSDLVTQAPPLYIQEKVSPKALIDDLMRSGQWSVASGQQEGEDEPATQIGFADMFADFNGLPEGADRTDFYQHQANWSNRMILGDSLQVMASLAEREGLRGQVQCIYIDPPYGIRFNSNFQWSTTSRDVRDGNSAHITREPEQVKAFRDTWRDGIHSYLTYLRERLTLARDLLSESGSIFVQIGDENVHRVRALMDEVFGKENFIANVVCVKTSGQASKYLAGIFDHVLMYGKISSKTKYRHLFRDKTLGGKGTSQYTWVRRDRAYDQSINLRGGESKLDESAVFAADNLAGQGAPIKPTPYQFEGQVYEPAPSNHWKPNFPDGMHRLAKAWRLKPIGNSLMYRRYLHDFKVVPMNNVWDDVLATGLTERKVYVVQSAQKLVERCILLTTDPGDLVLDPTCGSGTTAYVAEQWGRRWITIDTSRVALALARARVMGARYPWYLLSDSREGQVKEAEFSGRAPPAATHGDIRQGFVYNRVPHITLRDIANNAEIDVIWEQLQPAVEDALGDLNEALRGGSTGSPRTDGGSARADGSPAPPFESPTGGREGELIDFGAPDGAMVTLPSGESAPANGLLEWEVPREAPDDWPAAAREPLERFWQTRIARQQAIDASIAAKAEFEYLYDKPFEDRRTVRVAGPFTVESLSPHRMLGVDEHGELIDRASETPGHYGEPQDFAALILDQLRTAGVQQAHKEDRIEFDSLIPWPGEQVCAEGRYTVASGQWSVASEEDGKEGVRGYDGSRPVATGHWPPGTAIRAGIFIGPEFGTVQRQDLVEAAREAAEAGFDLLIACAFNYEAHATEFDKLGRVPVLKARMNADLHMAGELKNTGQGNLFVIFGEPDISVTSGQWLVARNGRMIANYEYVKELSGLESLEEINRVGGDGLSSLCELSAGREVRSDQPDAASGGVDRGEHRGGGGTPEHGGIPAVSGDRGGLAGGDGDTADPGATLGHGGPGTDTAGAFRGGRRWTDAERAETLAALKDLTSADFPLALAAGHWTQVTVRGVDVFDPSTGEVRSDDTDGIACWFIDTDYDSESFFVRHAYFLGANDPYKALKTTLKAEIDADAWATLQSDISRPFDRPASGRIAVKVINHLGDEVLKVFRVE